MRSFVVFSLLVFAMSLVPTPSDEQQVAISMQRAADKAGRILGIAYYRRMYPQVIRAMELIRQNAIGKPVFAEATSHYWFCPGSEDERSW